MGSKNTQAASLQDLSDDAILSLHRLLLENIDSMFDTRSPHFENLSEKLASNKVILCGYDPLLSPLFVYWLLREKSSIAAIAEDDRAGERIFRRHVLSSFDLAQQTMSKDAILVNCCTHKRSAFEIYQRIAAHLEQPILNPQSYAFVARSLGRKIQMTLEPDFFVESILRHVDQHLDVYSEFKDKHSQQVFLSVLLGRLSIDFNWFWNACSPFEDLYFPDFFHYSDTEIFVDAGAFDGADTLRFLRKRHYTFGGAHLFEMAPANLKKITKNVGGLSELRLRSRIHIHPMGLWEQKKEVAFCSEGINAFLSEIDQKGVQTAQTDKCQVTDLDSVIDKATLIKLEIEGSEIPALRGAKRILKQHRPNLAISAYHLSLDIPNILEFLRELDLGYEFRMRHYSGGETKTIIYASVNFAD